MVAKVLDRVPRVLSLLGLLGIFGLAGIIDPQFSRFSALGFLSYVCYFRFLRWFVKPQPSITAAGILVPLLGVLIWIIAQVLYPGLLATFPMFGFIGLPASLGSMSHLQVRVWTRLPDHSYRSYSRELLGNPGNPGRLLSCK